MASNMKNSAFSYTPAGVPIFAGEGYDLWCVLMTTYLIAQDLWNLVEAGADPSSSPKRITKEDARALTIIQQGVSATILPSIIKATTPKEAWQILKSQFQDNRGSKAVGQMEKDFTSRDAEGSSAPAASSTVQHEEGTIEEILVDMGEFGRTTVSGHPLARSTEEDLISPNMEAAPPSTGEENVGSQNTVAGTQTIHYQPRGEVARMLQRLMAGLPLYGSRREEHAGLQSAAAGTQTTQDQRLRGLARMFRRLIAGICVFGSDGEENVGSQNTAAGTQGTQDQTSQRRSKIFKGLIAGVSVIASASFALVVAPPESAKESKNGGYSLSAYILAGFTCVSFSLSSIFLIMMNRWGERCWHFSIGAAIFCLEITCYLGLRALGLSHSTYVYITIIFVAFLLVLLLAIFWDPIRRATGLTKKEASNRTNAPLEP